MVQKKGHLWIHWLGEQIDGGYHSGAGVGVHGVTLDRRVDGWWDGWFHSGVEEGVPGVTLVTKAEGWRNGGYYSGAEEIVPRAPLLR